MVAAKFFDDPAVDNDPGTHNGVKYARETVRKMLGTINLIGIGMWIATGIFALAAVLLISTTVRLSIFARRREVEIMRLVGATNWFIRWPFVLEGFITGLIGAVIAAGFVWLSQLGAGQLAREQRHQLPRHQGVQHVVAERLLACRPAADARRPRRRPRRPGQHGGAAALPQDLRRVAARR